jgi:hypothetical protein
LIKGERENVARLSTAFSSNVMGLQKKRASRGRVGQSLIGPRKKRAR